MMFPPTNFYPLSALAKTTTLLVYRQEFPDNNSEMLHSNLTKPHFDKSFKTTGSLRAVVWSFRSQCLMNHFTQNQFSHP